MRRLLHILFLTALLTAVATPAVAQNDRDCIRMGNRLYRQGKFDKSEVMYRKALSANAGNAQAMYNLGCALMQQKNDSAAITCFTSAGKAETSPVRRAKAYHNIGVICQQRQMYGEAIEAYKESLRNNPHDNATRYNLALCKKKQQENQQNQKNQQNQDKQNDKNKNKNQNQDQNQNQDKDKNQDKDQNKDQDKRQSQDDQMSRENAEQLLNAAMQEEKATQQRLKDAMRQPCRNKYQKNW